MKTHLKFKGKILIVDDTPEVLFLLGRKLSLLGLDIEEAEDYSTAINKINENKYDLVFSDMNLGGKHGGHILKYFRNLYPETPFYFISAYFGMISSHWQQKYLEAADGWIEKPFSDEKILEILSKHLNPSK